MSKKNKAGSMILGVAFVWFTTHFGGGFASGAQIYSYYVRYGIWSLFLPLFAMAYNGVFFAYCLYFARKHEVYDYRSYNNAFYGRFAPLFSNLFELLYLCVMCVAPAVAFATGGATLSTLTGLPYLLCTFVIGAFIFVVSVFGTDLVRKVASVLSICIIAGLLIVYVPNIIAGAGKIGDTVNAMKTADLPFGKALYAAFLYGTFQLANVAVFVQHAKSFEKPQDAGKSMAVGAVLNALLMIMVVFGIMTVYQNPEMSQQSVPTLFMVQQGVGSKFMTPLISVLIILGAVSTAVNMVAAMVKRIHAGLAERSSRTETAGKISSTQILAALACCIADFLIAQLGLLTLIQKAYSFLAYLAIPVILVPYVVHMIATRFDTK
ncbi:YkvI family membrane protein [Fusicatenibacter saccharivorans]|uniref:YkvI family membrane protein n=1 Tax=Fusicatenibacter saccharivorans TaxID=1150298 RepID=UPI003F9266C9